MSHEIDYKVGIDVGTNSVGFCALQVDANGMPVKLLSSMVKIHDSGVDPEKVKSAVTRLASAGFARRTRRLYRRRKKRLAELDRKLVELGMPIIDLESLPDPYAPWKARLLLVQEKLEASEQKRELSIALRHIARHRGWKNPYERIESLYHVQEDSDLFEDLKKRVSEKTGAVFVGGETLPEVLSHVGFNASERLRSAPSVKYGPRSLIDGENVEGETKDGIIGGKLMQSDNANEIHKIAQVQEIPDEIVKTLIDLVFKAESPKGSASKRVKKDSLPGQNNKPRAEKAHLSFQRFRIVSVIANMRLIDPENGELRKLNAAEKSKLIDFLMLPDDSDGITWGDVAEILDVPRECLQGTSKLAPEGERASSFPPVNVTHSRVMKCGVKPIVEWWEEANFEEKNALITLLSNADELDPDVPGADSANKLMESLSDKQLENLDKIKLPAGRAAYSIDSLDRLTEKMISDSLDLHKARKAEFGVPDDWRPPSDPIGEPVGNPAVDRVLKAVNRWLLAAEREWGAPLSVNIEHVRSGFTSESQVREYERDLKRRRERNQRVVSEANRKLGSQMVERRSDITRYVSVRRQNCQCAYCGEPITYQSCEMDHIVPRKGPGSTNTRDNLVAVCVRCNRAKTNIPFAVWAESTTIPSVSVKEAIARVRYWIKDEGLTLKQQRNFQNDVINRLKKKSADEEIDNRSIESVAWMANELHARVKGHFESVGAETKVTVFRGAITAEARKATGFEGKVNLIGGHVKTRFDRRHHAMDAAVISLMRPSVAKTLAERSNIKQSQRITRRAEDWKNYRGRDEGSRNIFDRWSRQMDQMLVLFNIALAEDAIPVTQDVRLRVGNGRAHDDTIRPLAAKRVGDSWTLQEIDRAATEQMWCALTQQSDFDPVEGLPENQLRKVRVKNIFYEANDELRILPKQIAAIPVRNGYAEIGNTIHHARIYKFGSKKPKYGMIRVFTHDLLKNKSDDVFTVELKPSSVSMRNAESSVRKAVLKGEAEYLGWLVTGSELELDLSDSYFSQKAIGELLKDFPETNRWVVSGFDSNKQLKLRPRLLAAEGSEKVALNDGSKVIICDKGWRPSVNLLFSKASFLRKICRTALGRERTKSDSGLPISVTLKES